MRFLFNELRAQIITLNTHDYILYSPVITKSCIILICLYRQNVENVEKKI